jgi:hypothetical protein
VSAETRAIDRAHKWLDSMLRCPTLAASYADMVREELEYLRKLVVAGEKP